MVLGGYRSAAEDAAFLVNTLSDSELEQLSLRVQRQSTIHYGSVSNAIRTLKVDTRFRVPKREMKRFFADLGEAPTVVEGFFVREDPERTGYVPLKAVRTAFDPISAVYEGSYEGSEAPTQMKSTKCQDLLEKVRLADNEKFQAIQGALKKIGLAARSRNATVAKTFVALDRDKSGYINRKEIRDFFRLYGFTAADSEFFFNFFDTERQGLLAFRDFCSVITDYYNWEEINDAKAVSKDHCLDSKARISAMPMPKGDPELCAVIKVLCQNAAAKHSSTRSCFHSMDLDGTGTITRKEVQAFFRNYGYPSKAIANKFFDYLDVDGNNVINYQEFKEFFAPMIHPASKPGQADDNTADGDCRMSEYDSSFATPNLKLSYEGGIW